MQKEWFEVQKRRHIKHGLELDHDMRDTEGEIPRWGGGGGGLTGNSIGAVQLHVK